MTHKPPGVQFHYIINTHLLVRVSDTLERGRHTRLKTLRKLTINSMGYYLLAVTGTKSSEKS